MHQPRTHPIAVQIGDPELAQAPRFILRLSKDLRPSLPPTMVQFLAANFAHMYEHYGNMATYMRIRGIVPPTSEKSASPKPASEKSGSPAQD